MSYLYEEAQQTEYVVKFKPEDLIELRDILGNYIEDKGEALKDVIFSMMQDYTNSMNLVNYMNQTVKAIQLYKQIRKTLTEISTVSTEPFEHDSVNGIKERFSEKSFVGGVTQDKVCPPKVKKEKS